MTMMGRRIKKFLLITGLLVMVLAITVPSVAAFESYKVNGRAHIQEFSGKTAKLATDVDLEWAPDGALPDDVVIYGDPRAWKDAEGTWHIPLKTCIAWVVTIYVSNPYEYDM